MTIRQHKLANGFRIVTERMEGLKSASIGVWVDAGGRHERAEQNGIAHFLEHMAFKGTKRRSSLDIAEALEDVGGYLNAYTSRETTAYYARVLENDVSLALDVIGDIVLNPVFDPREIEVERGVILQEIGQANDTPDDIIFDWLQEAAYPDQPIGRSILGADKLVEGFSRADLSGFVAERYSPDQMILAAAGAVDHDQILREAEAMFGAIDRRPSEQVLAAKFGGGEKRVVKPLEQAHMTLAFETPGYRSDDVFTAQIYAMILGGGMSSRLFQEAREKRGLCYSIFASAGVFADTGLMTVYAGTSQDDLAGLTALCVEEIRKSVDDISRPELERARTQLKAGLLMGLESPASRTERLARMVSIWGRVPGLEETIARIEAVSIEGLQAFSSQICTSRKSAMALYGPVGGAPSLSDLTDRLAA